jgi:cell division protein FtsQ
VNIKATITKIFFVSLWVIIGGGIITLLAAAMHKQKNERCRDYVIKIKGAHSDLFINEAEITELLNRSVGAELKGLTLPSFHLNQLEKELENNIWVEDAEIYFDSKAVLHIIVTEKKPIARIFTLTGNSFYIDNSLRKLPLSEKISARVPVFTGFPDRKSWLMKDSVLVRDVRKIAQFVLHDEFWMSQVSQIEIIPEKEFELIPMVGNHVVKLGNAENLESKLDRLFVFYKKVLSQTGFNKYPVIDVQYRGQVIVTKVNEKRPVDSVQLRKNVERLLRSGNTILTELNEKNKDNTVKNVSPSLETHDPNALKTESVSGQAEKKVDEKKVPKAVMPKRVTDLRKSQQDKQQ